MKSFRPNGKERVECIPGDRNSDWYLSMLFVKNMPAGTWTAIKERQITPTISEVARLAGLTIDDKPPLTVDDLIGVRSLAGISKKAEAFYFSGPRHPVLDQMRMSRHYLSIQDFLEVAKYIGLSEADAEKYFANLLEHAFIDENLETYGDPYEYKGYDPTRIKYIKRFAIRRRFAEKISDGEYKTNLFAYSGYIQSLIKGTLSKDARTAYLQLAAELEEEPALIVSNDDENKFIWQQTYTDADSRVIGNMGYDRMYDPIHWLTQSLLQDIGAVFDYKHGISQSAFITIANALCPYDKIHKDHLSKGELCPCGVHFGKMNPRAVRVAKNIAHLLSSQAGNVVNDLDEIDESDPDLESKPTTPANDFDW